MSRRALLSLLGLAAALGLGACDTQSDGGADGSVLLYTVPLRPLNGSNASGTALLTLDEDSGTLTVQVDVQGLTATAHPQQLRGAPNGDGSAEATCPTASADVNFDGRVDVIEGLPVFGGDLLPLDDDITTQAANPAGYPTGAAYSYARSTTFVQLASELSRLDPNFSDAIATLGPGVDVDLEKYVVVIQGTTAVQDPTVQTYPGTSAATTLPVACGAIGRPTRQR